MALQNCGAVGLDERDVPDHDGRQAELPVHRLQPRGFGQLLVHCTRGLDVDATDDMEAVQGVGIVRRHVVATDLAIVAEEEILVVLVLLGGVVARTQIPKMMVGVDDRHREIMRWRESAEEIQFSARHFCRLDEAGVPERCQRGLLACRIAGPGGKRSLSD
jgi:hypothetical protein